MFLRKRQDLIEKLTPFLKARENLEKLAKAGVLSIMRKRARLVFIKEHFQLTCEDMLKIAKSGKKHKLIKLEDIDYYERLAYDVLCKTTVSKLYYELRCSDYDYKMKYYKLHYGRTESADEYIKLNKKCKVDLATLR
jgi:hypothetical protein